MEINLNLNPAAEMLQCFQLRYNHDEVELNELLGKLETMNSKIKIITDVMNRLVHAKQKDEKIDFSKDETMKRYIAFIHRNNPHIFEDLVKGIPDHTYANDEDLAALGQKVTLEDVLNNSLKDIDLNKVAISPLTEDQIDVIIQGLDGELKMHSADVNKFMMQISYKYDERSPLTESARKMLDQANGLLERMNQHMARS